MPSEIYAKKNDDGRSWTAFEKNPNPHGNDIVLLVRSTKAKALKDGKERVESIYDGSFFDEPGQNEADEP